MRWVLLMTAASKRPAARPQRLLEPDMRVGDHQFNPAQCMGEQLAQERRPPRVILGAQHVDSEDLAAAATT
jgi:hypothetical protein